MTITIITLFPHFFDSIFSYSILKRAIESKALTINIVDLRDFGIGKHKTVDDKPYGGGVGMVLRVDVMAHALNSVRKGKKEAVILLDPKGELYSQKKAEEFAKYDHLILVCGHYEGFDDRIRDLVDFEVSIGDYVLSGGELAAALVAESVSRLSPGVLKKEEATEFESFSEGTEGRILEFPHYTRPFEFDGKKVPEVLLSGNFKKIEEYRDVEAKKITKKRRPELLKK